MSTKNIIYVGLDVDNTAFHGAGIIRETGDIFEFKCKPDPGVLRKKLSFSLTAMKFIFFMKHIIWVILCVAFYEKPRYIAM